MSTGAISQIDMAKLADSYGTNVTIGMIGSHSALPIATSAKMLGMQTVIFVQKGRESVYTRHNAKLYDHVIELENFSDILWKRHQDRLKELNTVLIPNRSVSAYVHSEGEAWYDEIETEFGIPIYGQRRILRAEDRKDEHSQYKLLEKSGVRVPKAFDSPDKIDRPVIVKAQQHDKKLERGFFYAVSPADFDAERRKAIERGVTDANEIDNARIEEFVMGPRFNADFHYWGMREIFSPFDYIGATDRIQVNVGGLLNLPAAVQLKIEATGMPIYNEEIGHKPVTIRESKLPLFYNAAQALYDSDYIQKMYPPGLIGMVGIQGAIQYVWGTKDVEFVTFDFSPRVPGDPILDSNFTEMFRLNLKYLDILKCAKVDAPLNTGLVINTPLDLTMLDIKTAAQQKVLGRIVT